MSGIEININDIKNIALKAGKAVMEIYKKDFSIEYKDDKSPLTEADTKANEIICSSLKKLYPSIPIMSEENKEIPYEVRKDWEYYWCIDPIDGTKEFIKKNDEFTINIALIYKNTPVLGIVYAPAIDIIYSAKKGEGAFKNRNKIERIESIENDRDNRKVRVVASKSHLNDETQDFIDKLKEKYDEVELVSKGSSLKLCMVADGSADIYPRLAPTMEWDTAAADAIVREAGKMTYIYDENFPIDSISSIASIDSMKYNKENLLNPWFVVK